MRILLFCLFAVRAAALYITASAEKPFATLVTPTTNRIDIGKATSERSAATLSSPSPSMTFSALVTIAPLSRNPLELRQRCFNDQGFSVNCATWTGYYYTWGGAGHPYEGGPGEGSGSGAGSSNRNDATTYVMRRNNRFEGLKLAVSAALFTIWVSALS